MRFEVAGYIPHTPFVPVVVRQSDCVQSIALSDFNHTHNKQTVYLAAPTPTAAPCALHRPWQVGAYIFDGARGHTRVVTWDEGGSAPPSWRQLSGGAYCNTSPRGVHNSGTRSIILENRCSVNNDGTATCSSMAACKQRCQETPDCNFINSRHDGGDCYTLQTCTGAPRLYGHGWYEAWELSGAAAWQRENPRGHRWVQQGQTIVGEAQGDEAGFSVALSEDGLTLAIGANGNDDGAGGVQPGTVGPGHVEVYRRASNAASAQWVPLGRDLDGTVQDGHYGEWAWRWSRAPVVEPDVFFLFFFSQKKMKKKMSPLLAITNVYRYRGFPWPQPGSVGLCSHKRPLYRLRLPWGLVRGVQYSSYLPSTARSSLVVYPSISFLLGATQAPIR